jgi:hypothetical protein
MPHKLDRWGITVSTAAGLDAASRLVHYQDARCRIESEVKPLAEDRGEGTPN